MSKKRDTARDPLAEARAAIDHAEARLAEDRALDERIREELKQLDAQGRELAADARRVTMSGREVSRELREQRNEIAARVRELNEILPDAGLLIRTAVARVNAARRAYQLRLFQRTAGEAASAADEVDGLVAAFASACIQVQDKWRAAHTEGAAAGFGMPRRILDGSPIRWALEDRLAHTLGFSRPPAAVRGRPIAEFAGLSQVVERAEREAARQLAIARGEIDPPDVETPIITVDDPAPELEMVT